MSMVVLLSFVTSLRSFSELAFFNLSSHAFVSILPKTDIFAYMIRLVKLPVIEIQYFFAGVISILPKTDVSKTSVRINLGCTGAELFDFLVFRKYFDRNLMTKTKAKCSKLFTV
jgi:hypothetical protein